MQPGTCEPGAVPSPCGRQEAAGTVPSPDQCRDGACQAAGSQADSGLYS